MKKLILLFLLIGCLAIGFYVYVDTKDPVLSWDVDNGSSVNGGVNLTVVDDGGLKEVCYTLSGGGCADRQQCVSDISGPSVEIEITPEQCATSVEPFPVKITVSAVDMSLLPNKISGQIEVTFDNQPPVVERLSGSRSLKQGGTGVVLYEVGEVPAETGVVLNDVYFRAFEFEPNKYLSFYVHPYDVAADHFTPRVFARDAAGNLRKIRPGSRTAAHAYPSEEIELTDRFLSIVQEKMMIDASVSPLDAFVRINDELRQKNYQAIKNVCERTEAQKLWAGAFLRNQGATRANFADHRTYRYGTDIVSRQVHTGLDIAGVSQTEIVAANHGKVVFTSELGIYGNVVILDHGYGVHSLYGHLSQILVQEGEVVRKGQPIAASGETGLAFGDHLHFEIRVNGIPVNPTEWFDKDWVAVNIEAFLPTDE